MGADTIGFDQGTVTGFKSNCKVNPLVVQCSHAYNICVHSVHMHTSQQTTLLYVADCALGGLNHTEAVTHLRVRVSPTRNEGVKEKGGGG